MKHSLFCSILILLSLLRPAYLFADEEIGIVEEPPQHETQNAASSGDTPATVSPSTEEPAAAVKEEEQKVGAKTFNEDQTGTISIETTPDGAAIDINGTDLGITPWSRSGFLPGFYRITLEKEGMPTFQETVELRAGETVRIKHDFTGETTPAEIITSGSSGIEKTDTTRETVETPEQTAQQRGGGTLSISCNTDSTAVVINKVKLGVTPFSRKGFLPGYYEVELKKSGYESFRKMVKVSDDSTTVVEAVLEPFFGRLIVTSTPENANVLINDVLSGTTPYDTNGIKPNTYRIRLELDDHVPWTTYQTIEKNRCDTITANLMTIAAYDSLKKVRRHRFKITRRIVFGSFTAGFLAAGMYYNSRAEQQLEIEQNAWNSYMEENRTTEEYESRYTEYRETAETTDLFMKRRNAMYILGGIFCVGLAISIPF
ncbi:MAG: PEGA domain-containing protein [Chitinispirillaceae bacterium]|nr:PEGA domain-containing protein [Chitinispirillaceae bacterium]